MATETKKSQDFATNSLFEVLSDYITEEEILNNLEIKIWEKLAKAEWLTYEEARNYVRQKKLDGKEDYAAFAKSDAKPKDIPSSPYKTYKNKGWISWGDFLGTGRIANQNRVYLEFEEAREYARGLGLKSSVEWFKKSKDGLIPNNIPKNPRRKYKDKGWKGYKDWLGTDEE